MRLAVRSERASLCAELEEWCDDESNSSHLGLADMRVDEHAALDGGRDGGVVIGRRVRHVPQEQD